MVVKLNSNILSIDFTFSTTEYYQTTIFGSIVIKLQPVPGVVLFAEKKNLVFSRRIYPNFVTRFNSPL